MIKMHKYKRSLRKTGFHEVLTGFHAAVEEPTKEAAGSSNDEMMGKK